MKKKLLRLIIFIAITIVLLIIVKFDIDKIILKSPKEQVRVLKNMYEDLTSRYPYYIEFDNSALKNIITNEYFDEENITNLKSINNKREKTDTKIVLFSSYNKNNNTITLKTNTVSNGRISQVQEQSYKLKVKNWKLEAISNGIGHLYFFDFATD